MLSRDGGFRSGDSCAQSLAALYSVSAKCTDLLEPKDNIASDSKDVGSNSQVNAMEILKIVYKIIGKPNIF